MPPNSTVFLTFTYVFFSEFITERKSKGEVLVFKRSHFRRVKKEAKKQDIEAGTSNEKIGDKASSDGSSDVNILRQTSVRFSQSFAASTFPDIQQIFSWSNVCFSVKIKKENRTILDHVDGWVKPGVCGAASYSTSSFADARP